MGRFMFLLWCVVLFLPGCEYFDDSDSAISSDPAALMRVAVPGWQPEGQKSVREIVSPPAGTDAGVEAESEASIYALAPSLVIKLADDKLVLIVVGTPADEQGVPQVGHASAAMLGAYWFDKRGERWFKVTEQPGFAQEGFFGNPGELRQVDMGGGKVALAVENGSCWQGRCGQWLALYGIGDTGIAKVFGELISSGSEGASESCEDLLNLGVGQQRRVMLESYSGASGCYRIEGRSKILPAGNGPGKLVIDFTGKTARDEIVQAGGDEAASAGDEDLAGDDPPEEFLVTVSAVKQRQVFGFRNGRYVPVEGENPNPGL